jgi:predicted transcriptional regulator
MHLKAFNDQQRSEAKNRIKELRERNFSLRKIAEMLNLSPATVHRYAQEMSVSETGEKT